MAKTNSPLRIMVVGDLYDAPEIAELIEKGHEVVCLDPVDHFDLILGEPCWYMWGPLLKYLPIAVKNARRKRREQTKAAPKPVTKPRKPRKKKDA